MRKYELKINEEKILVEVVSFTSSSAQLKVDGKEVSVDVLSMVSDAPKPKKVLKPVAAPAHVASATPAPTPSGPVAGVIAAPIPGSVMEVYVKVGDAVTAGQTVLKMEAMKMENEIKATAAGTVKEVKVSAGTTVAQGQELVLLA